MYQDFGRPSLEQLRDIATESSLIADCSRIQLMTVSDGHGVRVRYGSEVSPLTLDGSTPQNPANARTNCFL